MLTIKEAELLRLIGYKIKDRYAELAIILLSSRIAKTFIA